MEYCDANKRLKVYFIDWLFIIIIYIIIMSLMMIGCYLIDLILKQNMLIGTAYDIIYYTSLITSVFIYPLFKDMIFKCGSIGCKLSKFKIKSVNGDEPTKKQLLIRGIFFHLFFIDYIIMKIDINYSPLSDKVSKTKMVQKTFDD